MFKFTILCFSILFSLSSIAQETVTDTAAEPKGWTTWVSLGGQITSDPAACTAGNITFVFARGTDNRIWYRKRFLPTGIWTAWKVIADGFGTPGKPSITGAPAAHCWLTTNNNNNLANVLLTAVGADNRVWAINGWGSDISDSFGGWYQMTAFNAALYSGPAMAGWGYDQMYTLARGGDNRIYIREYYSGTTNNFFQVFINEPIYNDVAAVMSSSVRFDVIYRDQYGKLWQKFRDGLLWQPKQLIPGVTYSAPEVVSRDISTLDLFAKGYNNTLIHKRSINGVWGAWENLGGQITSGPGATTYANKNRIFVFARWSNGQLYYRAWAP